jgi:hypothetical protein
MKKQNIAGVSGITILLGLILVMQTGCSYAFKGIKGNGNVVKQERKVTGFSGLEVGGAFRVFLTQGDEEKLIIEADENLLPVIETKVKGGTLIISTNENIKDFKTLNIYLTFKDMRDMEISGACHLTGENKFRFDDLELDCSGASEVDMKLSAGSLDMDISGASSVKLYGSAEKTNMDVSGASKLNAYELETEKCDAEVSGAASVKIFVSDELSAEVSGASKMRYKGNASLISHDVSGAGSLKKAE